jgi:hypothetical protein
MFDGVTTQPIPDKFVSFSRNWSGGNLTRLARRRQSPSRNP